MLVKNRFTKNNGLKREPSQAELIERGFAPRDGKIDILFIYPPVLLEGRESFHHRPMLPLGIAHLAGYLREKNCGVGVLDCPGLEIQADKIYEIINNLSKEGVSILLVSSELEEVMGLADRAYLVKNGETINEIIPNKTSIDDVLFELFDAKKKLINE